MRWIALAASLGVWAWLVPSISIAQELDYDEDGIEDYLDNCSEVVNWGQDDTDGDDCGNLCDADYNNDGIVGFPDFGIFLGLCFPPIPYPGPIPYEVACHVEPIPGCRCGFPDFGFFVGRFLRAPGPSGTTLGTTACP
jgi:hypothetical protein